MIQAAVQEQKAEVIVAVAVVVEVIVEVEARGRVFVGWRSFLFALYFSPVLNLVINVQQVS